MKPSLDHSGIKKGAFWMGMRVSEVKEASKIVGATLNDFITCCLSLSCQEYFEKHKEDGPAVD